MATIEERLARLRQDTGRSDTRRRLEAMREDIQKDLKTKNSVSNYADLLPAPTGMTHKSGKFDDPSPSAADLNAARNRQWMQSVAYQPTSDMYLNRRTAEAANEMQKISDKAASNARQINNHKRNLYDDLNEQRRKTNQAFRDTVLSAPTIAPAPGYENQAWAEYNANERKLRQEENKLHEMGGAGDYEIIPGAVNSAHSGYVNAVGTLNDFFNQYGAAPTVFNPDGTVNWLESVKAYKPSETVQAAVDKAHKTADALQENASRSISGIKEGRGRIANVLTDAGVSGIQMAGDALLSNIVPGAGLAAMGVRAFGNAAQDARQRGANVVKQMGYGAAVAGVEILSEKLFDGLAGIYGKGMLDKASKKVGDFVNKMVKTEGGKRVLNLLKSAGEEGFEEFFSGIIDPALETIIDGERIFGNDRWGKDTWADIWESVLVGSLLGGLGGTVELASGRNVDAEDRAKAAAAEYEYRQQANNTINWAYDVMQKYGTNSEQARVAREVMKQVQQNLQNMARQEYGSFNQTMPTQQEYEDARASEAGRFFSGMGPEAVQSIIDTGLESAEGTESRRLAQEYDTRAKKGETLTQEEIGKLYRANVGAIQQEQVKEAAEKLGIRTEDKSAEQVRKEVDQTLSKMQNASEEDLKKMQTGANGMVTLALHTMGEEGVKLAQDFALRAMDTDYADYYNEARTVYDMGRNGEKNTFKGDILTEKDAARWYQAGVADAKEENNGGYQQGQSGNAGEGRVNGVDSAQPGPAVAGGAEGQLAGEAAQNRGANAAAVSADVAAAQGAAREVADRVAAVKKATAGQQRVSSTEAGLTNGTNAKTMWMLDDNEQVKSIPVVQQIYADAEEQGIKVHLYAGTMIADDGHGPFAARGMNVGDGGEIWLRVDTSEDLWKVWRHEDFHTLEKRDPGLDERVRQKIYAENKGKQLMDLLAMYAENYDSPMTDEQILREIFADAYAGINIFSHLTRGEGDVRAEDFTDIVRQTVKESPEKPTGPPSETVNMASTEAGAKETLRRLGAEERYEYVVPASIARIMSSQEYHPPASVNDLAELASHDTLPEWAQKYINGGGSKEALQAIQRFDDMIWKQIGGQFTDAQLMMQALVPSGTVASTKFGPLRTNVEYRRSFDMDTSCPRTFQFVAYRNAISQRIGRPLTFNESINLINLMAAYHQMIPCTYCYVENKRILKAAYYNNFYSFHNAVMNGINSGLTVDDLRPLMYGWDAKKGKLTDAAEKTLTQKWMNDKSGYNPTIEENYHTVNVIRNAAMHLLDNMKAEGKITANTTVPSLTNIIAKEYGITSKGALSEVTKMAEDWRYDAGRDAEHVYLIEDMGEEVDKKIADRALELDNEAVSYANSASSAKTVDNYAPYAGELENISEADRKYILGMGGIRKHSSNDFRIDYVLDYFQFFADLAKGKWTGHTYTKNGDYVRIFGRTGDMINMSIAFNDTADGVVENLSEGMEHKLAKELREAYENAGVMAMVTSDKQLSYALNADWVDMIIPFHNSGMPKAIWYNMKAWSDYTSVQGESLYSAEEMKAALQSRGVSTDKMSAAEVKAAFKETFGIKEAIDSETGKAFAPHFFPYETEQHGVKIPGHNNSKARYMELCKEYGVHPRFDGVTVQDADGNDINVVDHPNYMKLVKETSRATEDFKQPTIEFSFNKADKYLTEKYGKQLGKQSVTPMDYAMARLMEEAKNGGYQNAADDQFGIVDEFVREYAGKGRPAGWLSDRAEMTKEALDTAQDTLVEANRDAMREEFQKTEGKKPKPKVRSNFYADMASREAGRVETDVISGRRFISLSDKDGLREDRQNVIVRAANAEVKDLGTKSPFSDGFLDYLQSSTEKTVSVTRAKTTEEMKQARLGRLRSLVRNSDKLFHGTATNAQTHYDIVVGRPGLEETATNAENRKSITPVVALSSIKELLENAILVGNASTIIDTKVPLKGKNSPTRLYQDLYVAPFSLDGQGAYFAIMRVDVLDDNLSSTLNKFYNLNSVEITEAAGNEDFIAAFQAESSDPLASKISIADIAANVNPNYVGNHVDATENGVNMASRESDADYMKTVESGETFRAERMVRDAAKEWGAVTNERGRPLDLYHGTGAFGFTRFDLGKTKSSEGLIYATTKREVAANYAGRDHYAGVRPIGKRFIENATRTKDIIQNAQSVYQSDYHVMTDEERTSVKGRIEKEAKRIADKINSIPDHYDLGKWDDEDYTFTNALANVEDLFFLIEGAESEGYTKEELKGYLQSDIDRFEDNLSKVRTYLVEHRDELLKSNKTAYDLFTGYELFDAYVDVAYSYMKLLDDGELLTNGKTSIERPADLQSRMDDTHNVGAYHLYGNIGDKPLIIDAEDRDWLSLKAPEVMGDDKYHSTDAIAKEAKKQGYTALVVKNVYDGGAKADDYIFFSENQVKSADPVTYDDDGNVIPLSERFNPEKQDIRYSREVDTRLRDENIELKKRLDAALADVKQTRSWKANPADVSRVAADMIAATGTKQFAHIVESKIRNLVEAASNGGISSEEMKDLALDIARGMVRRSESLVSPDSSSYSEIMQYLKKINVKVPAEIRDEMRDWKAFAAAHKALKTKVADGVSISTVYSQLQKIAGEEYFPALKSDTAKLEQIAEILDNLAPIFDNPYSVNMAEATEETANAILDSILEIGQAAPTFADRAAAKEQSVRSEYQQRMAEQKQYLQERIAAEAQKRKDAIEGLKEHYAEVRENQRTRKAESADRQKLLRVAKRLQNRKMTAANRALVDSYIKDLDTVSVNLTNKSLTDLHELADWYDSYKDDPNFLHIPQIEEKLKRLGQRHIGEMTIDEVRELTDVLRSIENSLAQYGKMIRTEDRRLVSEMSAESQENIRSTKGSKKGLGDWLVTNTLAPERLVRRLTGYNENDPLYLRTKELSEGQRKMFDYQRRAEALFSKWANDKKFIDKIRNKEIVKVRGFVDGKETEIEITPDMRMALYLHSLNDQNLKHIMNGGVTIPDIDLYRKGKTAEAYAAGVTAKMSPDMVRGIANGMSAEERAFAEAARKYFNGMSKDEINAVSEALLGYSLAGVENYFPIQTDDAFTQREIDAIQNDGSIQGMGFTKERVNASNAIFLVPMTDVLKRSIQNHAKYVGMAIPVANMNKLWKANTQDGETDSTSGLKSVMRAKWGVRANEAIEKILTDVQNPHVERDDLGKALAKVRSNYAGAVLSLNASVALKQAASYPTAAAVLGWGPVMQAMGKIGKVDLDLINKYTPLQWYRSQGYSTQELGDIKGQQGLMDKILSAHITTKDGRDVPLLNWIQGIDLMTTRKLWKASEIYVQQNNKALKVGSDEYYKAVSDIYNRVIEETQPNYTTMQRPQLLRTNNELARTLVMFKTQPFQNFNILYDAIGELRAAERMAKNGDSSKLAEARKNAVNAITSNLVSAAVFAAMTMAWALARRKKEKYEDEEGNFNPWKQLGKDVASSEFGMIPFGSDAYELLASWVFGDKYYGMSNITSDSLSGALDSTKKAFDEIGSVLKTWLDGDSETKVDPEQLARKMFAAAQDASKLLGVPLDNVINLITAAYANVATATKGEYVTAYEILRLTKGFSSSTNKAKAYDLLFKAYSQGDESYDDLLKKMQEDFSEKELKNAMETRIAQGVTKVEDLDHRWFAPTDQTRYDAVLGEVKNSTAGKKASNDQLSALENAMYDYVVGNNSGTKISDKIDGGSSVGLNANEYFQYLLALSVVDQPNESGKLGTYTNEEQEAAIRMVDGLSDAERSYLWGLSHDSDKNNPFGEAPAKEDKKATAKADTKTEAKTGKADTGKTDATAKAKSETVRLDIATVDGSSSISRASYNPDKQEAYITWSSSGKTYTYKNISQAEWDAFKKASSKGNYVNKHWK